MKAAPRFYIIMPSYNQGPFLNIAIRSIIDQNVDDWHLHILDGGSTDNSVKVIRKWAKRYPNKISWRSYNDKGQVEAINEGLSYARGQIISYLNSDDYYLPHAFSKVDAFFKQHSDCKWLVGDCKCSDHKLSFSFYLKQIIPYASFPALLYLSNFINQPAVFLHTDLVNEIGKFDDSLNYAFDYDYWLRCLEKCMPCRLRSNIAVFRIHSQSKGNSSFHLQFDEDFLVCKKYAPNLIFVYLHWMLNLGIKAAYIMLK